MPGKPLEFARISHVYRSYVEENHLLGGGYAKMIHLAYKNQNKNKKKGQNRPSEIRLSGVPPYNAYKNPKPTKKTKGINSWVGGNPA